MKPAEFDYLRAGGIAEICDALADGSEDEERKIIAGGQTLAPLMAMRLARPSLLIDINDVEELKGIAAIGDSLIVRAGTRQRYAEHSPEIAAHLPLLGRAIRFVGHWQTRNRGTVGGSLACADPSAEIPLVARTLDAGIVARSTARGERVIAAADFFQGAMMTALADDECLTEIRFPVWSGAGTVGCGFHEVSSRQSDFAVAAAAAQLSFDDDGICRRAACGVGGVAPAPVRLVDVAEALVGARLDEATVEDAAASMADAIEPDDDVHASADYRRRVARVLLQRAIIDARDEALP